MGARTRILGLTLLLSSSGCSPFLESGTWGTARYFGEVEGTAPLRVLAPRTDRDGNIYVLNASRDRAEANVFVGSALDGWTQACSHHKGDSFGAHGWVGRADDRMWYWSGEALVEVRADGTCDPVLDTDPSTGTNLRFKGVIPYVTDTPSQTYVVALVSSGADPTPYQVVVDLRTHRYRNVRRFSPESASNVRVVGVGAGDDGLGFALISYEDADQGGMGVTVARFYDRDAATVDEVFVAWELLDEHALLGYLQADDEGNVAGLLTDGRLITFDRSRNASVEPVTSLVPRGVHRWAGDLWLVGEDAGEPRIAQISGNGDLAAPVRWSASMRAASALGGIDVLDDRTDPSPMLHWDDARTGIGSWPFLSEHSLDVYAIDTTGWIVAGPTFNTGIEGSTSVAFAPAGVSYP